jgi:cytochrome c-type biogenesis protein CcmH/NrfG
MSATPPKLEQARTLTLQAHRTDPLAVQPLLVLANIDSIEHHGDAALADLQGAVRLQPANPDTWTQLAAYQLSQLNQVREARSSLDAALYLDPRSFDAIQLLLQVNRAATATG